SLERRLGGLARRRRPSCHLMSCQGFSAAQGPSTGGSNRNPLQRSQFRALYAFARVGRNRNAGKCVSSPCACDRFATGLAEAATPRGFRLLSFGPLFL